MSQPGPSLSTLPPELHLHLLPFILTLSLPEISSFSRTSRYFHALLTPHLYAHPHPTTLKTLTLLCTTLYSNPHRLGRHIRSLTYIHPNTWDAKESIMVHRKGSLEIIKKAVRRTWLPNLTRLELVITGEERINAGWWGAEWQKVLEKEGEGERRLEAAIGVVTATKGEARFWVPPTEGVRGWEKTGARAIWRRVEEEGDGV